MIRKATTADMQPLLSMAMSFYDYLPFKERFDHESVAASMVNLIESETGVIFTDDNVECMLGAMVYPSWMNNSVFIAQEMFWWSENPHSSTALLKNFEEWGISKGASYLNMIRLELDEPNQLDNLYQRKGYRTLEHVYFKEV